MKSLTIRLNPEDNVLVAVDDLEPGGRAADDGVSCLDRIPAGHKIAARDIGPDEPVLKYGQIIGFAREPIGRGRHVHTHNVYLKDFSRDYAIGAHTRPTAYLPEVERAVFMGIVRPDGRVATRNYIGILPMVSCAAGVSNLIAAAIGDREQAAFPNVDGVTALGHDLGCGMAGSGEGFDVLQRTLGGYARHPNFAGVLLVGLGCEVNQMDDLMRNTDLNQGPMLRTLNIQDIGGTPKTVARGAALVKEMMAEADRITRQAVPADRLVVGLECGGSDAYSGISANPALGAAADLVVRNGGTVVLAETPEIYGAEHLLTRRAETPEVGRKLVERIKWWEDYTSQLGAEMNNNPSPGNKAGGLTTILEKSLGAMAKGGTTNLVQVCGYGEPVTGRGLVFMDTPGYDIVSITGMIAGGANVVCFTTGRGTVCGSKPAPTIKLATNTPMYRRMEDDMDVNCGTIVDGETNIDQMGCSVFDLILQTASGKKTKSEHWLLGDNEFAPWHLGATM